MSEIDRRIRRLSDALRMVAKWAGVDIAELIDEGYLESEDLT